MYTYKNSEAEHPADWQKMLPKNPNGEEWVLLSKQEEKF